MWLSRPERWLLTVYAACMAGAALNHLRLFAQFGWQLDRGAAAWQNAFWTSLTVLDAVGVVLLLRRPRAGVVFTAAIILADVPVNVLSAWSYRFELRELLPLLGQVAFLGFVLGSAPFLLQKGRHKGSGDA